MARRNAALAVGLLTLSFALVACGGATSPSPTGEVLGETSAPLGETTAPLATEPAASAAASGQGAAEAAACAAIQAWSDEMRALAATDPATASVDDVRAQVESIRTAWDEVKASLNEVTAADEEAVMNAGSTLETAVDDLATDVPISEMVSQVQAGAQPLKDSYKEMADGLGCALQNPY